MLTACGIETIMIERFVKFHVLFWLQQCLPLAVLKRKQKKDKEYCEDTLVATVLTACGIETGQ